ncbi:hypothetical protein L21SP2_3246 [Salinispira pacifica]|uniref:Uncharacterized protein n=1 Tax=Salinispira pacifica TaxID=1307761 RepID=V5WNJ6_9SPIO|nr:hypothetical protein L21SP2_3246 [Salinispira pacifica]
MMPFYPHHPRGYRNFEQFPDLITVWYAVWRYVGSAETEPPQEDGT